MEKNFTNCNNIKLTTGSRITLGRTEYTILGTFTDDGEEFLMAKYLSRGKYPCYCAIAYDEEFAGGYYRHS